MEPQLYDVFAALRNTAHDGEPKPSQPAVRSWCYRQPDITPTKRTDDGTLIFLVTKDRLDNIIERFNSRKRVSRGTAKREYDFNGAGDNFASAVCEANVVRARRKREAAELLEKEVAAATDECQKQCKRRWEEADQVFLKAVEAATGRCKDEALAISDHGLS